MRIVFCILLIIVFCMSAVSALDGYDYYQEISYTACDQAIYQQDIVIHRTTGNAYEEVSGSLNIFHLYVDDHCQEDYGDIRFTDASGNALAYYLWPDYDAESARFTVRLEGADAAGVTQIHYGNPTATTTSDPDAVYAFFDDYSDPTALDNYTELWYITTWGAGHNLYYKEIVDGRLHLGWDGPHYGCALLYANSPLSDGQFRIEAMFQATGVIGDNRHQKELGLTTPTTPTYDYSGSFAADFSGFGGTVIAMPGDGGQTAPAGSTGHAEYILGSTPRYPGIWIQDLSSASPRSEIWIDYILVRAYSATPPSASEFSGELAFSNDVISYPGHDTKPTDPDADGLYEDVNGNGRLDFQDIMIFFQYNAWAQANQPNVSYFDWSGNGVIEFSDVQLFWEKEFT